LALSSAPYQHSRFASPQGSRAIGITANFVNTHTSAENQIKEFGILRVYNQQFFNDLNTKYGIDLENLVYYRGETHYFVMTAMFKRYALPLLL
jgi:formyltetrahydrofolate hydrolase